MEQMQQHGALLDTQFGVSGNCLQHYLHQICSRDVIRSDIKDRFSQSNGPRIFQLQKAISVLSQNNQFVSSYYTSLKGLWDELNNYRPLPLCSCGTSRVVLEYQHQEYVFQLLMGLNESFSHIKCQILLLDPLPPINKIFSMAMQEERQREITSTFFAPLNHIPAAMASKSTPSYRPQGSRTQGFVRKERPFCTHCGLLGHTIERCYKLHGYPPRYKTNIETRKLDLQQMWCVILLYPHFQLLLSNVSNS